MNSIKLAELEHDLMMKQIDSITKLLKSVGGHAEFDFQKGIYDPVLASMVWVDRVDLFYDNKVVLYGDKSELEYIYKRNNIYEIRSDLMRPSELLQLIEIYISSWYGSTTDK